MRNSFEQVALVQKQLFANNADLDLDIVAAMTYGQPGIDTVLKDAEHKLYDHIILFHYFRSILQLQLHLYMMRLHNGY